MAFTDLGSLGATGSSANNQSTLVLTTAAAVAAGELVVVIVADDNRANGGDDLAVTGVTDSGGNTWTKAIQIANALAAQAGASCSLWYTNATNAIANGGTITATFGSSTASDATAMTARHFSKSGSIAVEGTPGALVNNTGADPGSLNVTTANIACLRIRGLAVQVGNNTNLTPTASWTAWANGNSATTGTTAEMCARAEHIISTATGAASDPTYVSAIYASVYVAFKEVPPTGTLAVTEDIDTAGLTGLVGLVGTLVVTETIDSASITGLVGRIGTLGPTEAADTASFAGVNQSDRYGTLAVFEAAAAAPTADATDYSADSTLPTADAVNDGDVAGFTGTVEAAGVITGTVAATEVADTAIIAGSVTWLATLAATEAADAAAISGNVGLIGTLSTTEVVDAAAVTGTVAWLGTLAATEGTDSTAATGLVGLIGTLSATEAADTFAATGSVTAAGEIIGALAATEVADTTALVGEVTGAAGTLAATEASDVAAFAGVVEAAVVSGGGGVFRPPRPFPVEGAGFGILPQIEGEAHGVVVVTGAAVGRFPSLTGAATGAVGGAGRGAAQLAVVRAAALGDCGEAGAAVAVLKSLSVASKGAAGVQGSGSGLIAKLEAAATGRHDDDEAAVMTFLLAA